MPSTYGTLQKFFATSREGFATVREASCEVNDERLLAKHCGATHASQLRSRVAVVASQLWSCTYKHFAKLMTLREAHDTS